MSPFVPLAVLGVLALFSKPSKAAPAPAATQPVTTPPRPSVIVAPSPASAMDSIVNADAATAKAKTQLTNFATNVFDTLKF